MTSKSIHTSPIAVTLESLVGLCNNDDSYMITIVASFIIIKNDNNYHCDSQIIEPQYLRTIMPNKNTLGIKKVRGQSEAACKQAGATKSFDIS